MVSVIIAAFNEAPTVGQVVAGVIGHPDLAEVIVVDDGSSDDTARRAAEAGARVLRLDRNRGKATALDEGVAAAAGEVLLFLDADITGLNHVLVSQLVDPVLAGRVDMHVGLRARKTVWLNRWMRVFPIIGGERALCRTLWAKVPSEHKRGFRIEVALNHTAKYRGKGMSFEFIEGIRHRTKERKFGYWRGFRQRLEMIGEVVVVTWSLYIVGGLRRRLTGQSRDELRDRG